MFGIHGKWGRAVAACTRLFKIPAVELMGGPGGLSRSKGPFSSSPVGPGWRIPGGTINTRVRAAKGTNACSFHQLERCHNYLPVIVHAFISAHVWLLQLFPSVSCSPACLRRSSTFHPEHFVLFLFSAACFVPGHHHSHHPVSVGGSSFPMSATHTHAHTHSKQTFTCCGLYRQQVVHLIIFVTCRRG